MILYVLRRISATSQLYEQINVSSIIGTVLIILSGGFLKIRVNYPLIKKTLITALAISFILNSLLLNIDRSRSFYVLSWVANGDVNTSASTLVVTAKSEESRNAEATLLRIQENEARGLIERKSNTYKLTFQGKMLLKVSNFLSKVFLLENWEVNKY